VPWTNLEQLTKAKTAKSKDKGRRKALKEQKKADKDKATAGKLGNLNG
jgi:hypothetical protein